MKKEQERLYKVYKDIGITREYLSTMIENYAKLGKPKEYTLSAVRSALSLVFSMPSEFRLDDYAALSEKAPLEVEQLYNEIKEMLQIAERYRDKGVNITMINDLVQKGLKSGFTRKTALAGVRLGLSMEYGRHEYFKADEVAEILNISIEEAERMLADYLSDTVSIPEAMTTKFIQ